MAEVLLFHHAQGQTAGFHAFADELRQAGHTVHTPDLFEGRTFASIDEGMAYAEELGFPDEIIRRADRAVSELPNELVYAGFSLGAVPAQKLAQTRPGARGALLFYSCVPLKYFGGRWPAGVPVQIHGMDADPYFSARATLTPPASSSSRRIGPSCSCTPATSTTSPTPACRPTTLTPRRC
jgi:dienelactone hydrolase